MMVKRVLAAACVVGLYLDLGLCAVSAQAPRRDDSIPRQSSRQVDPAQASRPPAGSSESEPMTGGPAGRRWQRREVDWRAGSGRRIKAIYVPKDGTLSAKRERRADVDRSVRKREAVVGSSSASSGSIQALAAGPVNDIQIDSPPASGFVPHIVVAVTDKCSTDDDWVAQTEYSVRGRYLTDDPATNYVIGLFDTGAGAHVMGHAAAERTGVFAARRVTSHVVELLGATGSVSAFVSYPLAIFVDGLSALDPNGLLLDDSNMVGQSNVSVVVGDAPPAGRPDLPTAIGAPLSVNFVTAIHNDHKVTVTYDGNEYTGPDIQFYDFGDSRIPEYPGYIPLNLIPAGGMNIQYIPDFEAIFELIFEPGQPSIIVGVSAQSLFFVDSVDLHNGTRSAVDKRRFMLDTGAQVTVIGSSIGSRLGLSRTAPDFEVEITDVTGETTIQPAFFIDSLEIPALDGWLMYSNVPVVMMDVDSPEGGYLEGIIGMNLFVEFDLVLRGGGLLGLDMPSLEFTRIRLPPPGDIAPAQGDGTVDYLDLAAFAAAWLSSSGTAGWDPRADLAPRQLPDGVVDGIDFGVFAAHWREALSAPAGSQ
jgi:predicted aspartyl protease